MLGGKIFRVGSATIRQLNTSSINGIRQAKIKFPIIQTLKRSAQTRAGVRSWEAVKKPSGFSGKLCIYYLLLLYYFLKYGKSFCSVLPVILSCI